MNFTVTQFECFMKVATVAVLALTAPCLNVLIRPF